MSEQDETLGPFAQQQDVPRNSLSGADPGCYANPPERGAWPVTASPCLARVLLYPLEAGLRAQRRLCGWFPRLRAQASPHRDMPPLPTKRCCSDAAVCAFVTQTVVLAKPSRRLLAAGSHGVGHDPLLP